MVDLVVDHNQHCHFPTTTVIVNGTLHRGGCDWNHFFDVDRCAHFAQFVDCDRLQISMVKDIGQDIDD